MSNTTLLSNAYRLTKPGLQMIQMNYGKQPAEFKEFFDTYSSDRAEEIKLQMKGLGPAHVKAEGSDSYVDTFKQRYIKTARNRTYALSCKVSREFLEENLYKAAVPQMGESLALSMVETKNIEAANIINEGFTTNSPAWDGKAFFAPDHPYDGGTNANTFNALMPLHETSLEQALTSISLFRSQSGIIGQVKARKLIIPSGLEWQAERLTKSQFRTGTANNDINALYSLKAIPEGYAINRFISSNIWFIRTDQPGLDHYERWPFRINMQPNSQQLTLLITASERFVFSASDPLAAFGAQTPTAS